MYVPSNVQVSDDIAPGYSSVVRHPMDLSTMQAKLHRYRAFADFEADARLIWDNCHLYNGPDSYYSKVRPAFEALSGDFFTLLIHAPNSSR